MSEWGDMYTRGLLLVQYKSNLIIISLKINLFSQWYSWKNWWDGVNQESLTHSIDMADHYIPSLMSVPSLSVPYIYDSQYLIASTCTVPTQSGQPISLHFLCLIGTRDNASAFLWRLSPPDAIALNWQLKKNILLTSINLNC